MSTQLLYRASRSESKRIEPLGGARCRVVNAPELLDEVRAAALRLRRVRRRFLAAATVERVTGC